MTADDVLGRVEALLRRGGADETSVAYVRRRSGASRFASSRLTQCAETDEPLCEVRTAVQGRVGAARTGDLSAEALAAAHGRAVAAARARPPIDGFAGFPARAPAPAAGGWVEATARATAADRAEALGAAFAEAEARGLGCAGLLLTSEIERGVASIRGVRAFSRQTFAKVEVIASDGDASGHAATAHADFAALDIAAAARRAFERAERARDPIAVEPGRHDVILDPAAVKEILEWLAFTAFGARSILDGTSPLAGRLGAPLFGSNVTVVDDPLTTDGGATPRPFDSEGVPSARVVLVEGGVARGFVSDALTAARLGALSTGHAADPGHEDGPVPTHLRIAPGDAPRVDLARRLGRGLLVTRFHYVNGLLDTRRALMTGLTRDGLFVVEEGEVRRAARNLRWTQSIVEAFARVEALSREVEAAPTWWTGGSAFHVPAMLIRGWNFDSAAGR